MDQDLRRLDELGEEDLDESEQNNNETANEGSAWFVYSGGRAPRQVIRARVASFVRQLDHGAFQDCKQLRDLQFDDNNALDQVLSDALAGCISLRKIKLPRSLSSLGPRSLSTTSLEVCDLSQASQLIILPDACLSGCVHLIDVQLPPKLQWLGNDALAHCARLRSVTLPPSVTHVGDRAFSHCLRLRTCHLEQSNLLSLGQFCFWNCQQLQYLGLPKKSITLKQSCLSHCVSLPSLDLASSFSLVLEEGALQYCLSLKTLILPNPVRHDLQLEWNIFHECPQLQQIKFISIQEEREQGTTNLEDDDESTEVHFNNDGETDQQLAQIPLAYWPQLLLQFQDDYGKLDCLADMERVNRMTCVFSLLTAYANELF